MKAAADRYALGEAELADCLNTWHNIPSIPKAAAILATALRHLVAEADAYSDAMLAVGRGAHELGSDAPSYSASWIAKRALDAYAEALKFGAAHPSDLLPAAALYCKLHDAEWDPGEFCAECACESQYGQERSGA